MSKSKTNRAPRSASTREKETRRKPWTPPSLLDTPPAPPGIHYRWIRIEAGGREDKLNVGKRFREGYVPVKSEEIEDQGYELPTIDEGKHAGVVGVGGLILCKIPEETAQERRDYYTEKSQGAMASIDAQLESNSNPAMPIQAPTRKTVTKFGNPDNKPETE